MTGMPAFGHAHSDEEIWAMVAFLQHMPTMSPQEYASELREAGPHVHDSKGEAPDDHVASASEAREDHEKGDSDIHQTQEEMVTQDESHESHDHSHDPNWG